MRNEKKYIIHILAVKGLSYDTVDLPLEQCAFIICTPSTSSFIDNKIKEYKLVLNFADVEDTKHPYSFKHNQARQIIDFMDDLPVNVTDIYVCCDKGGSRSPACAAALLKISGRSDKDVWMNPFYVPNALVYRIICKEAGLFMPKWRVKYLKHKNEQAYKKAKKNRDPGKYERWQILY